MKKLTLLLAIILTGSALFAHTRPVDSTQQYLFIIRYKPNAFKLSGDALTSYQSHWRAWIANLAQTGKLVTGYRPATGGKTISGTGKTAKEAPYGSETEVVSSIFIIKAASPDEADGIARTCPIYESDGSIEIRPVTDMAH